MRSESSLAFGMKSWVQWSLGSGVGFVMGLLVTVAVGRILSPRLFPSRDLFDYVIAGLFGQPMLFVASGAIAAVAQWLVLRRWLPRAGSWIWIAAIGFLAGYFVFFSLHWVLEGGTGRSWLARRAVAWGAVGAAVGATQWFFLRRRSSRAGWWVPTNVLAFASAFTAGFSSPMDDAPALTDAMLGPFLGLGMRPTMAEMIVDHGVAGVVVGMITGAVLMWSSRRGLLLVALAGVALLVWRLLQAA